MAADASVPFAAARDLLAMIEESPTPRHCVVAAARRLTKSGFRRLREEDRWRLRAGDRRYVVREGALVAVAVGEESAAERGLRLIAAHTDSPNLRLKPKLLRLGDDALRVDAEPYGRVLLHTWLDRDLGIAGEVLIEEPRGLVRRLVRSKRPLCRIPSLAVHLDPSVNERGLVVNPHLHLVPLLAGAGPRASCLRALFERELSVDPGSVRGHDLSLFDCQPPSLGGIGRPFVSASRLDNQAMCHAAAAALCRSGASGGTRLIALFDHEEVGSRTASGAQGTLLSAVLERLMPDAQQRQRGLARSFIVSADMGHARHPNHPDRHSEEYAPTLNAGPMLKTNASQRYGTSATAASVFRQVCREADVPLQEFVNRADLACGATLGPMLNAALGAPVVDVGSPLLAMHSIREMAGAVDHEHVTNAFTKLLELPELS